MPSVDGFLAAWAALAGRGDKAAFERIYRSTLARIYSLARRIVGVQHADDAVQQVYARAWQKLGEFRGEAGVGTWLHKVALTVLVDDRARRRRIAERESAPEGPSEPAAREQASDWALDLEAALEHLPRGAREVFVLHDVEGHAHDEIAKLLGISPGTSRSQLHRARMLLRRRLCPDAEDER